MDYREKLYAVGRIPSTYNKREGTAKEHELLAVRAAPWKRRCVPRVHDWCLSCASRNACNAAKSYFVKLCSLITACLQGRRIGRALRPLFPRGFAQDCVVSHGMNGRAHVEAC